MTKLSIVLSLAAISLSSASLLISWSDDRVIDACSRFEHLQPAKTMALWGSYD